MKPIKIDKNRKLYRQEGQCGMYQVCMPFWTSAKAIKKYLPCTWGEGFLFGRNNYLVGLFYEDDFEKPACAFLDICEKGEPKEWLSEWLDFDKKLTVLSFSIYKTDVARLSLGELKKKYAELYKIHMDMWASCIFIDCFDSGLDQKEIEKISKKFNFTDDEVHILLTPDKPSFISLWERDCHEMNNGRISREDLKNNFFWYAMDYSRYREVSDFFIDESLKKIKKSPANHITDKTAILKKFNLKHNPFWVFVLLAEWRDERKRLNYTGLYGLMKTLREFLRRKNIDPDLVNSITPAESVSIFDTEPDENELRKRLTDGLFVHLDTTGDFDFTFGKEVRDFLHIAEEAYRNQQSQNKDVKGMVASKGTARGVVRVISNPHGPEAAGFREGDILVTSMTRPEFLHLMDLAAAFVTDEGGISSHAAIVAREMKKPCIIGTKIATKVLKDGDMVEVDAEKGVVKIL